MMDIEIEADRRVYKEILDSLSNVVQGEDNDRPMDLNVVAEDEEVRIYVRQMNVLQVSHTLTDEGDISVTVNQPGESVFSSQTLSSLINKAGQEPVELEIDGDSVSVSVEGHDLDGDLEFNLPLYKESEFQHPTSTEDHEEIIEMDRVGLRRDLSMMEAIEPEFTLSTDGDDLLLEVDDIIQGSGEARTELDQRPSFGDVENKYEIRAIVDYLKALKTDAVSVSIAPDRSIAISGDNLGRSSTLLFSARNL